ncbi:MAG: ATP-binding protein [Magnetococcales bacterium]|nr:ATP-binding protein [Magnetococcales bacterium]
MLVSFSVQNYRSFAERQQISLVAGTSSRKHERLAFETGNSHASHLLRTACLFGPNGSGKSSLIKAMQFYKLFVLTSAKMQTGEHISLTSFLLDQEWRQSPSEFEAEFIDPATGAFFQYGFVVDQERVWQEWLFRRTAKKGSKMLELFQRLYDPERQAYTVTFNHNQVKEKKSRKQDWIEATTDNALLLSTAVQLNANSFQEVFESIYDSWDILDSPGRLFSGYTAQQCHENEERWKQRIQHLMSRVDIPLHDIESVPKDLDFDDDGHARPDPNEILGFKKEKEKFELCAFDVSFLHSDSDGKPIPLKLQEESDGTQVLFGLAGPILYTLDRGTSLVVDELGNSLHPHALRFIVELFLNPKTNPNNAQLIFTSHETYVLADNLLHQDQIWLLDKGEQKQTVLVPLSDFNVRQYAAFQKAYLAGRFGGVPRIGDLPENFIPSRSTSTSGDEG